MSATPIAVRSAYRRSTLVLRKACPNQTSTAHVFSASGAIFLQAKGSAHLTGQQRKAGYNQHRERDR
jgi:hypothetical protein